MWGTGVNPNKKENNTRQPPKKCTYQTTRASWDFGSTFGSLFDWTCWSLKPGHLVDVQPTWTSHLASRHLICILFNQEWGNISHLQESLTSKMPDCFPNIFFFYSQQVARFGFEMLGSPSCKHHINCQPTLRFCNSALRPSTAFKGRFHQQKLWMSNCYFNTPRKFNITPENIPSEKESSLPTIIFQGRAVKLREGKCHFGENRMNIKLVVSWFNPFQKKHARQKLIISPGKGENKKCLKPPPMQI